MKLKNIFLSLVTAVMICNPLTAMYWRTMYGRPTYAPVIVCFVGATASGITAWWAHKKVQSLVQSFNALSDEEKNKSETLTKIKRYVGLLVVCTTFACITALTGTILSIETYKERQRIEEIVHPERNPQWERAAIEAHAQRKRAFEEQQRRRQMQRQTPGQKQQDQPAEQPHPTEQLPARELDATQPITQLERAAHNANYECGICFNKIENQSSFAIGSPSYACDHFYCTACIQQWRTRGLGRVLTCPTCRQG